MEEQQDPEIQEDLGTGGKFKNWLQDNIRIIISVLIVIAIAGGIYSYSKRGEVATTEEEIAMEETADEEGGAVTVIGEDEESEEAAEGEVTAGEPSTAEQEAKADEEVKVGQNAEESVDQNAEVSVSEETGEAFIEAAVKGDSKTTLARKALRDYLEKNQDSSLTAEHKIYIEDYLRKNVEHGGSLQVGDSISFSKVLIKDSIEKAKTLNESQLKNLEKYSARVSNL